MKTYRRLLLTVLSSLGPLCADATEPVAVDQPLGEILSSHLTIGENNALALDDTGRTLYDRNKRRIEERRRRYYRHRSAGNNWTGQWPYYNPRHLDKHTPDSECVEACPFKLDDEPLLEDEGKEDELLEEDLFTP